jgi:hypothetical protein
MINKRTDTKYYEYSQNTPCYFYTNQVGQINYLFFHRSFPMQTQVLEAVAALQSTWQNLPDVDRAEAIVHILAAGMSGRGLANALNCSEALIRHLKPLVEALPEEKRLARLGKISTRELKRRIAERKAEKANKKEQAAEFACLEAAHRGAYHTLQWFNKEEKIAYPYAEQIVLEARRKLREAERDGTLPTEKAPAGFSVSKIIRLCDLVVPPSPDDVSFMERYANWLSLWSYHAMPDGRVREKALDIALNELVARPT